MSAVEMAPASHAILLIDDEPAILELLSGILEGAGYRCHVALNGRDGLYIFRERQKEIALVMTDFNMPMMNGFDLTRAIRAIQPGVKVVLSSGSLGDSEKAVANELKVDALLPKPWNAAQVVACIDEIFAR